MNETEKPDVKNGGDAKTELNDTPRRRGKNILVGLGVLALIAVGCAGYWYFFMRGIVYTDDARFAGHLVDLAPEINGRLSAVLVREGMPAKRGQDMFLLDPATPQTALMQAEALLKSAQAGLAAAEARQDKAVNGSRPEEIRAGEATVKRLENETALAKLELDRLEELRKQNAVAQDRLDRARTTYESARQQGENAAQNLALLREGSRKEDIAAAQADVELARSKAAEATAAMDKAQQDLERCRVKSPFDGWVVRRWLDPGAMLAPGQPVISLFDPATLRVDANIEEKYLEDIAIGDEADIAVDAYPDLKIKGRVTDILRAANSKFSMIPSEGVAGTFIKVTQRVPLRIEVKVPADLPIGPGLSVEVKIRCGTAGAGQGG